MKMPMPPPTLQDLMERARDRDPDRFITIITRFAPFGSASDPYLPWDKLRHKSPPGDLTHDEWWMATKLARISARRRTALTDIDGREFTYALPDESLRGIEDISSGASGRISMSEQVTNPATRDRYLVNSLIEESITSSQLEGAATTRVVAKEMLRSGRPPRDRDERMIVNNFRAMQHISTLRENELTLDRIREIHHIVTEGTLDDPTSAGRFQAPNDQRVAVFSGSDLDTPMHRPPPASEIPDRMQAVCDFANHQDAGSYIPPILRAITLHFMIGYIHPFEDGNGRIARAVFYWLMLRNGYWLTEYISISRILKAAPSQYMRSYVHVEQDDSDLTYFHLYHLGVIKRAINDLNTYLARKMDEVREFQRSTTSMGNIFNHRQIALLENAVKDTITQYTTLSHATSHNVTQETARKDLIALERFALLTKRRVGHAFVWEPVADISDRLRAV